VPRFALIARALAIACGCRISPRRRPFVVGLYNERCVALVDSACGRGVVVSSAALVVDISNAFDLCDSHACKEHSLGTPEYDRSRETSVRTPAQRLLLTVAVKILHPGPL
jgi:hypothetical protein